MEIPDVNVFIISPTCQEGTIQIKRKGIDWATVALERGNQAIALDKLRTVI